MHGVNTKEKKGNCLIGRERSRHQGKKGEDTDKTKGGGRIRGGEKGERNRRNVKQKGKLVTRSQGEGKTTNDNNLWASNKKKPVATADEGKETNSRAAE